MNISGKEKMKEHKQHGEGMLPIALYIVPNNTKCAILPHHWHNELEFIYMHSGQAVFTIDDEAIHVQEGECVFVNSGSIHSGYSESDASTYCSVVFSTELITNSFDACRKFFDGIVSNQYKIISHFTPEIPSHKNVIDSLNVIIDEMTDKSFAFELVLKSKLLSLFSTIFRSGLYTLEDFGSYSKSKKYYMLKNVLGYIYQNFDKKIKLADVSSAYNLTPQYLSRFFKEMTGINIVDYINQYRIEKAVSLIKASDLSITDIALECGFDNIGYFNRVFKKQMGLTPTELRSSFSSSH